MCLFEQLVFGGFRMTLFLINKYKQTSKIRLHSLTWLYTHLLADKAGSYNYSSSYSIHALGICTSLTLATLRLKTLANHKCRQFDAGRHLAQNSRGYIRLAVLSQCYK